jgi:hypothetical protein
MSPSIESGGELAFWLDWSLRWISSPCLPSSLWSRYRAYHS